MLTADSSHHNLDLNLGKNEAGNGRSSTMSIEKRMVEHWISLLILLQATCYDSLWALDIPDCLFSETYHE
jgi:hypothetical protein